MKTYEKTIKTENIFTGKILKLDVETVLLPNNKEAKREIVRHPGAVAILPIYQNMEIIFVKQYRKAVNGELLEVPAGKLEYGEIPEDCALRELQEEIGYTARKLTLMGKFYSSPGFSSEIIYVYKAEELISSKLRTDEDEFINIVKYTINDSIKMLEQGLINDAKTAIALSLGLKL